jgi:nicotinamidase-related amidase
LIIEPVEPALPVDAVEWSAIERLASALDQAGGLIVSVSCARPPRFSDPGTVAPHPPADARFGATVSIAAPGWDGFFETNLDTLLRAGRRDLLLLVGGWLEVGVHSTMRSANDRGYECLLVPAACIPIDAVTAAATISSTEMSGGIFGAVAGPSGVLPLLTKE